MADATKDQGAEDSKLSPAELKKRAKAEKQARRAAQKGTEGSSGESQAQNGSPAGPARVPGSAAQDAKPSTEHVKAQQSRGQGKAGPSQGKHERSTEPSAKGSQSGAVPAKEMPAPKMENKQVRLVGHLYDRPRRHEIEGTSKDVHPAILALGFQMSSYEICGSSARCVAMLLAFKEVIQSYTTPAGTSLPRHMEKHYLSPQIEFLKECRTSSESMGNAIRHLKQVIAKLDPSKPEQEAKDELCDEIDRFIRERITLTDQAIADSACPHIKNGSVVVTYAKSSIVEKTVLQAHASGKKFRVICIDSRPLYEGKNLASSLMNAGLEVEYLPFSGIAHAVKAATVVLLGAHSMLSNGRLRSRIGTASVAMQAHQAGLPVIVCCGSVKFSGKVALDSIVLNEVAPPEELLLPVRAIVKATGSDDEGSKPKSLQDWKDVQNLQILNLMYDVTPKEYISMLICEYGSVPPSSVPVVHRLANEGI